MKSSRATRRFFTAMIIAALLLSLLGLGAAPVETFRVVRIRGQRVHMRQNVPPQLTHDHIVRHLGPGHLLYADREAYGISYDGKGTGVWLHVVDPNNGECGWVNARYVEDVNREPVEPVRGIAAPPPAEPKAPPAAGRDHDAPPPDALAEDPTVLTEFRKRYGADVQFAANLATLLMLGMMLLSSLTAFQGARPAALVTAGFTPEVDHLSSSADVGDSPHFIYGVSNGIAYRIPVNRKRG